jgi:hypothetical protein
LKVIRWLLSFYILGYPFYHLTPVFYTVHVNYAPPKPAPLPYQKTCKVVFGVKTALDGGVGRPNSLERALEEKGIAFFLLDTPLTTPHASKEVMYQKATDTEIWVD